MIFSASKIVMATYIADAARAGVFQLPITRTTVGWDIRFFDAENHLEILQAPLGVPSRVVQRVQKPRHREYFEQRRSLTNPKTDSMASIPFTPTGHHSDDEVIYWSIYTAPISIGNPPINLTALVDTSWSPLFVLSVNCTLDPNARGSCLSHTSLYNSTKSSTYRANLTPSKLLYKGYSGIYTMGNISQDNLHVADMEINGQIFEEATFWHPYLLTRDDYFDTALGLSLYQTTEPWGNFTTLSPFQNMIKQGLLNENIFTLKLSRTDDESGELTLGGIPDNLYRHPMIQVPLDYSRVGDGDESWEFYTSSGWQISTQSISTSFPNGSPNGSTPIITSEHTAIISSSHPYISLPEDAAAVANHAIGLEELYDWVDCDTRQNLPNMAFALGPESSTITLTPWDYLIEVYDDLFDELKCVSPFQSEEEKGEMGFIILGAPFLNGVWSVWDADRETISFANRPRQDEET